MLSKVHNLICNSGCPPPLTALFDSDTHLVSVWCIKVILHLFRVWWLLPIQIAQVQIISKTSSNYDMQWICLPVWNKGQSARWTYIYIEHHDMHISSSLNLEVKSLNFGAKSLNLDMKRIQTLCILLHRFPASWPQILTMFNLEVKQGAWQCNFANRINSRGSPLDWIW